MAMSIRRIIFITLGIVLLTAIVISKSFIFESLVIHGPSMEPTIMPGDRVLVNRIAYRSRRPDRGDIIVFRIGVERFVKRVIGLPGDVIDVRDGIIYRGSEIVASEPRIASHAHKTRPYVLTFCKVRERQVFVVGDNTDLSMDSRYFGAIPYKDIIGKVFLVYFPPGRIGKLQ